MTNFDFALNYTFKNEGILSDDKGDSGGLTKYGIILDDLIRYGRKDATTKDVLNLTKDEARAIYKRLYWDALKLDSVRHKGMTTAIFDIGVVCGVPAVMNMEKEIEICEPDKFIEKLSSKAKWRFRKIVMTKPSQLKFYAGWIARAKRLLELRGVK